MTGIAVDGQLATITFDSFGLEDYALFLKSKALPESQIEYEHTSDRYILTTPARFAALLGVPDAMPAVERLPLAEHLFDYQAYCVERALEAKRFACWLDCGLGKTSVLLEWARQVVHLTGGRVLILTPLAVIPQMREEARRWYGETMPTERLDSREALVAWCRRPGPGIGLSNSAKLIPGVINEFRYLAGLVADDLHEIKTGGGVIKWNLIKSCKGIEYKLSCTATPAPNDTMEYASQASFLEKLRTEGEILWTFFARDKFGTWRVKPHAKAAFYKFMSSWSIYVRDPARFGWRDVLGTLPPADTREYRVPLTLAQEDRMYDILGTAGKGMIGDDRLGIKERGKLSQLAKGFLYHTEGGKRRTESVASLKPLFVAELVRADVAEGRQVLVWTVFDEESAIIVKHLADLGGVAALHGAMADEERAAVLERFRLGELRVLISKAVLIGHGVNIQHCRSMVFSGFNDSAEQFYQAVRRCLRYGQTETVRVHIPYVKELEGLMWGNVQQKLRRFDEETAAQEAEYRKVLQAGEGAA